MMIDHLGKADDKRGAVKDILEIPKTIHGYENSEIRTIREITDEGLKLLTRIGDSKIVFPTFCSTKRYATFIDLLKTTPHLQLSTPENLPVRSLRKLHARMKRKSIHFFSSQRHLVLFTATTAQKYVYDDAIIT